LIPAVSVQSTVLTTNRCGLARPFSVSETFNVTDIALGLNYIDNALANANGNLIVRFYTSKRYMLNECPETLVGGPYTFTVPSSNNGNSAIYPKVSTPGLTFTKDTYYWAVFTTTTGGVRFECNASITLFPRRHVNNIQNTTATLLNQNFSVQTGWYSITLSEPDIAGLSVLNLTPNYTVYSGAENANAWGHSVFNKGMPIMRMFVSKP
jgi:hypothetical protein